MRESHEFTLYLPSISDWHAQQQKKVTDEDVIRRIVTILRLSQGEEIIFFNEHTHVRAEIVTIDKKFITLAVLEKFNNKKIHPALHWLLPILEKEAFEEAIYNLTAMGATSIQPIITQKVKRSFGKDKELERIHRIMIAAAEQSKQFILPELRPLVSFSEVLKNHEASKNKIFFDAAGQACYQLITELHKTKEEIICLIGPEGDLTTEEKELANRYKFMFCKLTPTILRAEQAVTVGMGILRTLL